MGLAGDDRLRKGAAGDDSYWGPETSPAAAPRGGEIKGCTKGRAEAQLYAARMGKVTCRAPLQLLCQLVPMASTPAQAAPGPTGTLSQPTAPSPLCLRSGGHRRAAGATASTDPSWYCREPAAGGCSGRALRLPPPHGQSELLLRPRSGTANPQPSLEMAHFSPTTT